SSRTNRHLDECASADRARPMLHSGYGIAPSGSSRSMNGRCLSAMRRRPHHTWLKRIRDAAATLVGRSSMEEALRASEQSRRELLEQAPDAIFLATPEGGFVDVNERACELLGYTREELLARSIADVLTPE